MRKANLISNYFQGNITSQEFFSFIKVSSTTMVSARLKLAFSVIFNVNKA